MLIFRTFSALFKLFLVNQGRRVPLRFTLAPGYYIPRLRRWAFALAIIFRAFGAGRLPWLLYSAPSALGVCLGFCIPRRRRSVQLSRVPIKNLGYALGSAFGLER